MNIFKVISCGTVLLAAFNIQAKPINLGDYSRVKTEIRGEKSTLLDAIEFAKARADNRKQLVLGSFQDNSGSKESQSINAGALLQQSLKGVLIDTVEFVDRNKSGEVLSELQLIELFSDNAVGSIDLLADFTVRGEVLSLSSGFEWTPSKTTTDDKGKTYRIPSNCTSSAKASISLEFYTLNPYKLHTTVSSSGDSSSQTENVSSCRGVSAAGNLQSALKEATSREDQLIQNIFSPSGVIVDHRSDAKGKKHIYKTTIKTTGVASKDSVIIYKIITDIDPITDEETTERSILAEGKVLDVTGEGAVWFKLGRKSKKAAENIKLGDSIEIIKKRSAFGNFTKSLNNMVN